MRVCSPCPPNRLTQPLALTWALALICSLTTRCATLPRGLPGQVAAPTPTVEPDGPDDADVQDGDLNGAEADGADDGPEGEAEALSAPEVGATVWLDRAFALWHDGHFAAAVDAMREALATGSLNDAGSALAYWHIYLAEQAQGHSGGGLKALSDFVAVAQDITTRSQRPGGEGLLEFCQSFDLAGRLARARATLNLAWAEQTHRAGHSAKQPVLVFDDVELSHFLELAPPCAQASDARVVALQRNTDHLGRATARATIRCRSGKAERHYFFAFIGPQQRATAFSAQASDQ